MISNKGAHFYEKIQTYIRCIFLPFTGFWYFGRLWEGRIFVRSCTVCIAEWQQAAEDRHDYFPEYDWVREILGDKADHAEVSMLLDNGVDLHSYQPTADDIIKISDCDLFVYVGGESDGWVEDALKEATNKNMKLSICLMC